MSTPVPFGTRLAAALDERGPLCVGIDPHPGLLTAWGLPDDPRGLRELALRVVDALGGRVAALKPQSALFERHGAAGVAVLEEVLVACRDTGVLSVLDVKRGDIGSTMAAYAQAYLADGAPLAADAVTLSPFLGLGSLAPAVELAHATGRGVFVLALTSNPEGATVQHAVGPEGRSVAAALVEGVAGLNAAGPVGEGLGSVGLVVGATTGSAVRDLGIDLAASRAPLLVPGIGAQGAGRAELAAVFAGAEHAVLASTSRAVLAAGPQAGDLRAAAADAGAEVRAAVSR
ncbi:orotidine-5'-phosphate decarboxylase [uncultured Georgenia sp.]|uniref:orotidine-5'-phosphate decarboxylase n=1 Tax=uncultured Georgenia sp. TaxID=378209 RepID=UPI00261883F5|nr:orotidine-5'-phosphate decarboxylase [uncultured Georgenia sp.]HLV05483.1 orotidine-5'-phosphate decarboxylase [Actinomycetaceae bacterium]